MQKFLLIKSTVVALFGGEQIISLQNIKTIDRTAGDGSETTIFYDDGTATAITTAPSAGYSITHTLNDAVKRAFQTSWTNPFYELDMTSEGIVSIINS